MPLLKYHCNSCGKHFARFVKATQEVSSCPFCGQDSQFVNATLAELCKAMINARSKFEYG
ncbi:MAG: hypothetical protein C0624_09145 [Desulfuromonas sp.]|nr:MAG: hypothetical protein C0624_09145 [Desulfuromonas sp.]